MVGDPPSGTVTFCDGSATPDGTCTDGTLLCTVQLTPGTTSSTAVCTHGFDGAGNHPLSAYYAGDDNYVATATTQAQAQAVSLAVNAPAVPTPALSTRMLGLLALLIAGMAGCAGRTSRTAAPSGNASRRRNASWFSARRGLFALHADK